MIQAIRARKSEGGFTLIELLIVIVILGILAGIVVFSVSAISDRGTAAACKSDLKSVEVAVEAYRAKIGNYPAAGSAGQTQLTTDPPPATNAKFLRSWPSNSAYTITLGANGAVSSSVDCSTL